MAMEGISKDKISRETLNSIDKAALVLYGLGEEAAAQVLKHMDQYDVEKISKRIAEIPVVPVAVVEEVMKEFYNKIVNNDDSIITMGEGYAKNLVKKVFGDKKAERLLQNISQRDMKSYTEIFHNLDLKVLSDFLKNEHPQTIALVLSQLDPEDAGQVLTTMPENIQTEVLSRIVKLESVPPDIISDVAAVLENEIKSVKTTHHQLGGVKAISEILNQMDRTVAGNILARIEDSDPETAEQIRQNMFVFEDLVGIDDRGFQEILKEISTDELAKAMKTASEEVKEKIFKNMSERAADMLREDIEDMGPTRLAEIERAQIDIVKVAMKLADEGKIVIGGGKDDVLV